MSDIMSVVQELVNKAQGYVSYGKVSGKEAEAVDHDVPTDAPKEDEKVKESRKANSGTHPEKGGAVGSSDRHEGGEDFKDGSEDTIGGEGKAAPGRPGTIKHEATTAGPNNPGTAADKQKQQKSEETNDLQKANDKDDDYDGGDDDDDDDDNEKEEKSLESGEVYLDINEFAEEIVNKAVERLSERFEETFDKSVESAYVEAGLAKSLNASLERIEELEKAVSNIAAAMNVRKSLLKSADNIRGINNSSLEGNNLSKSEISSKLLDLRMSGDRHVTDQMVLKYDATGDISTIPSIVKSKLGLE